MTLRVRGGFGAVAALWLSALAACSPRPAVDADYPKQVEAARTRHEAEYRKDYVALAGLAFLKPGPNRAGSDASNDVVLPASTPATLGTFVLTGQQVRFEPAPGVGTTVRGTLATTPIDLQSDGDAAKPGAPRPGSDQIAIGPVTMWVHDSGDRRAIRVRDEQGEVGRTFTGFRWFPIDAKWRVTGRFIKDPAPRQVQIPTLTGDFTTYTTEGLVEFTLEGQTIRMRPMTTKPGQLFFVFKDATSGKETYAAARFLDTELKDDGTTVLDFNEAYNPPCAFSPFTTCPLPPAENRLTLSILAGEKDYDGPTKHKAE